MKKLLFVGVLSLSAFTMWANGPWFSGKITYRNSFATLTGQDITDKISPIMGSENLYYVSDNNYKSYTEKKQLLQLYIGASNQSIFYVNGKATTVDAAVGASDAVVQPLEETIVVAGYKCKALQIDSEGNTTVYYYSSKLRVNPERYVPHRMGNWNTYLKASDGALPLKFIFTNRTQGYTMTSEATSVEPMVLAVSEFTESAVAR